MINRYLIAAAAVGGLAVAAPVQAQDAKPTPCVGFAAQDPSGDQAYGFAGNFTPAPADPSVDLTEMFFRNDDGKVTMNFTLADAKSTPPAGTAGIGIRVLYDSPADLFLDVDISSTGVVYSYGHFGDAGPEGDGETTGKIYEGPAGVISVDLPPSHGGKAGMKLTGTAFSFYNMGAVLGSTDYIPDEGSWKYNGAACSGSGSAPTPGSPAPTPGPAPGPQPAPSPGSPQTQALGKLAIKASPTKLKAKKVKKSAKFTLTSSEDVTNLTAALKKGSKTVGTGKLATVKKGKTPLKLKIKGKLKKGKYQLVLNGKKSDGSNGAAFIKISVK